MIFESSTGHPSLEELVLCDLFRNIDLREMRGIFVPVSVNNFILCYLFIFILSLSHPSILLINISIIILFCVCLCESYDISNHFQSFKHSMSHSTMSLLNAVRKRHSTMQGSFSEGSSPCTPPSTPRDRHGYVVLKHFYVHFIYFYYFYKF
jgi:PX domain-containing protein kinase-like protein